MSTYIKADQFYYPHGVRRGGYLELVDGKFGKHVESLPEGADVLDYSGYSIAPGLVDTHIHGFGGVDVMDNNIEGTLHTMSEGLLSTGVTSFLPTTLTSSYEQLLAVTENIGSRYKVALECPRATVTPSLVMVRTNSSTPSRSGARAILFNRPLDERC